MAETKEALRVEVSGVCKNYCPEVLHEALNQAEVEASSVLRKPKSVHYPPTIRTSGLTSSRTNIAPKVVEVVKDNPAKVLTSSDNPSEVAKQLGAT